MSRGRDVVIHPKRRISIRGMGADAIPKSQCSGKKKESAERKIYTPTKNIEFFSYCAGARLNLYFSKVTKRKKDDS